jgi:GST-like protein
MIQFYYNLAPNPMKVALFLEEAGLAYEPIPVDSRKGEQFAPAFTALNPNNKLPCIVDGDATVFDSNAILLYLAEKTGKFLPASDTQAARGEFLSWLMFVASGIGPYSGQAVHFRHFAPEPKDYALKRYAFEADRHWSILEQRLSGRRFMLGETYTILDMAVWGWEGHVPPHRLRGCLQTRPGGHPRPIRVASDSPGHVSRQAQSGWGERRPG